MKSKIFNKKNVTWILLLSLICSVLSCRKSDDHVSGEESGKVAVQFKINGITEGGTSSAVAKATSLDKIKLAQTGTVFVKETAFNKDYNMVTTITTDASPVSVSASAALSGVKTSDNRAAWTTTPGTSTTTPVPATLQYRVLVFDDNGDRVKVFGTNNYINSTYTAATQSVAANAIQLDAGKYYYFVAVASLTTPTIAPAVATTITRLEDVLYSVDNTDDRLHFVERQYVGNKVEEGTHTININFKHVNSKVTLSIEASLDMGNITAVSNLSKITGTGKTNITSSGTKTTLAGSPYTSTFTSFTYTNRTTTSPSIAKSSGILVSSAGVVNTNSHTINIPSVTMNNGTGRTNIPDIVVPANTFESGVSYTIHVSFQPTGIAVGGLIWARGNLSYDWRNKIYFIRYYPQETGVNYQHTDFWAWGSNSNTLNPPLPKRVANNEGDNYAPFTVDPCSMVPGGMWRTPTAADFAALGVYKVHNGGGAEGANNTSFNGGTNAAPNGSLANNYPYIYFDGTVETIGGAERLRFYKAGRYYGDVSASNMTSNINGPAYGTAGGNSDYEINTAQYMTFDAMTQNNGTPYTNNRLHPVRIDDGASSGGVNTFATNRASSTFTEDDRIPVRCVKNL